MLIGRWVSRLVRDDSAEDLVEYALLTLFIGLAGVGIASFIVIALRTGYGNWDSGTQNQWEPPAPSPT